MSWFFHELPAVVEKAVTPGEGSAYRSSQTVEGKPTDSVMKMGFKIVRLHKPGRRPGAPGTISYTPNGRRSKVASAASFGGNIMENSGSPGDPTGRT